MTIRKFPRNMLALTLVALAGCAHTQTGPDAPSVPPSAQSGGVQPGEMGPPLPPPAPMGPEAPVGPLPVPGYVPPKDGYVLVLGPGLARTIAYIGVLKEMESRNLAIHGLVTVEMGAVIGSIWASSNTSNLEWEMHKFKRDTLLDLPVFGLGDKVAEGKKLYDFLESAVKVAQLQQLRVPTVVASAVPNTDTILNESNGSAKDIVRGATSIPGLLKPSTWDGKERESAAFEAPFPVDQARSLAVGKIVCIDVIGRGDNFRPTDAAETQLATLMRSVSALARQQLKGCDTVIAVPMDGVSYLNFEGKADLISRGRAAVRKWLEPQQ